MNPTNTAKIIDPTNTAEDEKRLMRMKEIILQQIKESKYHSVKKGTKKFL
jgi:hypothetical protein